MNCNDYKESDACNRVDGCLYDNRQRRCRPTLTEGDLSRSPYYNVSPTLPLSSLVQIHSYMGNSLSELYPHNPHLILERVESEAIRDIREEILALLRVVPNRDEYFIQQLYKRLVQNNQYRNGPKSEYIISDLIIESGHRGMIELLFRNGNSIEEYLSSLIEYGHPFILQYMMEAFLIPDDVDTTELLRTAVQNDDIVSLEYLVERQAADINGWDGDGAIIRAAVESGHYHLVDVLEDYGADLSITDEL